MRARRIHGHGHRAVVQGCAAELCATGRMALLMATSFPLSWPVGWPRTKPTDRRSARFRRTESVYSAALGRNYTDRRAITISSALDRVVREIERMGVPHQKIIFSTNVELGKNGWPLSTRR